MNKLKPFAFFLLLTSLAGCDTDASSATSSSLSTSDVSSITASSESSSISSSTDSSITTSSESTIHEITAWNEYTTLGHSLPAFEFNEKRYWSFITNESNIETLSPSMDRNINIEGEFTFSDLAKYEKVLVDNGYVNQTDDYESISEYEGHVIYDCFFDDGVTFHVVIHLAAEDWTVITDNTPATYIEFKIYAEQGSLTYPEKNVSAILKEVGLENITLVLPDNVKFYMYSLVEDFIDEELAPAFLSLGIFCENAATNIGNYIVKLIDADYTMKQMVFTSSDKSHQIETILSDTTSNGIEVYYLEISKVK